jgi:hypothetical protein
MKKTFIALTIAFTTGSIVAAPLFPDSTKRTSLFPSGREKMSLTENTDKEQLKGRLIVSGGAGFNLFATSLILKYAFRYSVDPASANAGPIFHAGADYGILKNLSAGVDAGFQKATVGLSYYDNNGNYVLYNDSWKRYYFAARVDYHIVAKNNIDLYTGVRLGYNMYSVNHTAPVAYQPYYTYYTPSQLNLATGIIHAHIGFSYFFAGIAGLNAEFGLGYGGPFIGSLGVCVKI